jgi:hypothetical protein
MFVLGVVVYISIFYKIFSMSNKMVYVRVVIPKLILEIEKIVLDGVTVSI